MKFGKFAMISHKWGDIQIAKNKSFEYQFEDGSFMRDDLFEFKISWTSKCDHAGISFTLGIKGFFWMNLNVHDHRHWDEEKKTWTTYQ